MPRTLLRVPRIRCSKRSSSKILFPRQIHFDRPNIGLFFSYIHANEIWIGWKHWESVELWLQIINLAPGRCQLTTWDYPDDERHCVCIACQYWHCYVFSTLTHTDTGTQRHITIATSRNRLANPIFVCLLSVLVCDHSRLRCALLQILSHTVWFDQK